MRSATRPGSDWRGCCWGTWQTLILPYIEQGNVFSTYQSTITGVSKTDGMNNHTSTDPLMVAARQAQIAQTLRRLGGPQHSASDERHLSAELLGEVDEDLAVMLGDRSA